MSPDKLAYMANQIGKFFAHQKHDAAVAAIADHLEKFWDPRMRRTILSQYESASERLDRPGPRGHRTITQRALVLIARRHQDMFALPSARSTAC